MSQKLIIGLLALVAAIGIALADEVSKLNPFSYQPFTIKKENSEIKDYRRNFVRLTGFEYSGLHWDQFVVIYAKESQPIYQYNYLEFVRTALSEDDEEDDSTPEFKQYNRGDIILKENYDKQQGRPGNPVSLTYMIKREAGYDQENGNWEYVQLDLQGNTMMRGNTTNPKVKALCFGCHVNIAERDFIFSNFYTKSSK